MTIASEIARLQGVKTDILGAIAEKKVDVPSGAMLADAPDLIRSIKSGINVKIGQGVYPAVKIGNQLWLARNLDEELGTLGVNEWYYNNDEAKAKANNYGRLYTWDNINANLTKLGLTKWRWPTTADFNRLVALDPNGKSYATFGNGTNTTGLSFVSSGVMFSDGTFSGNAFNMYSNVSNRNAAERLRYQYNFFAVEYTDKNRALSVRLVLDLNDDGTIPDSNIVIEEPATTAEPLALASEHIVTEETE